jgi:hypothetical protein
VKHFVASLFLAAFALTALASRAGAQETALAEPAPLWRPAPRPYLHLQAGLGYTSASDSSPAKEKVSGPSISLGFAGGWVLVRDLSVFGTVFGELMPGAQYESLGELGPQTLTGAALFGVGAGLAYRWDPVDLYASLALAATVVQTLDLGNEGAIGNRSTRAGRGVQTIVGKEWRRSPAGWGLGIAAELVLASMPEGGDTWSAAAFSLLFSSTY